MARPTKAEVAAREEERRRQEDARVEARVIEMLPGLIAKLTEKQYTARVAAGTTDDVDKNSDRNLVESLATAIVRAGDPTNQNRMVDPQIMQQRRDAHERMVTLIMKFNAESIMPVYTIRAKMYLNDVLVDPQYQDPGTKRFHDTQINWDIIPNEGMVPVNEAAKQIHAEYKKSIGSVIVEGLPKAPWQVADAPWIQTKDGLVRGREIEPIPEFADDVQRGGPYKDPRRGGFSPAPATPPLPMFGTTGGVKVVEAQ